MHDLNTLIPADSGWNLATATKINNSGQIIGGGHYNGQYRAFLATPRHSYGAARHLRRRCGRRLRGGDRHYPPKVMSTSPANKATGIASSVNVSATFSEATDASTTDGDPSTISGTTFKLVKLNADGTTTRVTATLRYAVATKKAKLDPASNLSSGTYKATVTTGAQDLANNALDQKPNIVGNQPKSWKFKVQ